MMDEADPKCSRCGETAHKDDNIMGVSFAGLIETTTETVTSRKVRIAAWHRYHETGRVLQCDEDKPLCDPCWGLMVNFLQGREVVGVNHEHNWKKMNKFPILDRCDLCYKTRVNP